MKRQYWLMKSEPDVYSIAHLQKDRTTLWGGVRNYQARNFMTQQMQVGDRVLFYHSNATPPGIAGLAVVSKSFVPDPTQFDKKSEYYDPKASLENPIWFCVEIEYVQAFKNFVSLENLRSAKELSDMLVLKKGSRLSIQPVLESEYREVKRLGGLP